MENPQMGMPAEMAPQGPNPEEMAIYEQMRQEISPQEFSNEMLAGASQVDPQAVAEFTQELQGLEMPPEALDALNDVVDEILASPERYQELRTQYMEQGLPEDILPEQFDPNFFAALNMAIDQMIAAPTGVQAFAEGGIAELKPIAKAIASYGRNGDTMLAHITPAEARMLRRRGGSGTTNPATGLPEFFNLFKSIGKALKSVGKAVKKFASSTVGRLVTTVALGFFLGPAAASFLGVSSVAGVAAVSGFVGSAGSTLLGGGNLKDALKAGAIGGLTAGAGAGVMGGADAFASGSYTGPTTIGGQFDKFKGILPGSAPVSAPGLDPSGAAPVPVDGAVASVGPNQMPAPPAADPLGDFIQQNDAARAAANSPARLPGSGADQGQFQGSLAKAPAAEPGMFDQAKEFYNKNISPSGIQEAGIPTAQDAGAKAVNNLLTRVPTATPAMQEAAYQVAYKAAMPGMLSTYGPMAAVGIGAMSAFGGFDTKPVQSGPITQSLMKPVTQRIAEDGTQRQMYMQGLPGVQYDEFGAPIFGQSSRLPTYDVPDYNSGGFGNYGMSDQGIMNVPTMYNTPSGSIGSRRVAQPYNNSDMYSNLVPRRAADGGYIQHFDAGGVANSDNPPSPNDLAAIKERDAEALRASQLANRTKAAEARALKKAQGSGSMYANINAGLSALAPENFPGAPLALSAERSAAMTDAFKGAKTDADYARTMRANGYRPEEVAALTGVGYGDINRRYNTALRQDAYAPMLQGQRNAMDQQAGIAASGQLPRDISMYSGQNKADLYRGLSRQGLTDPQIRAAAENRYGMQTDADFRALQNAVADPTLYTQRPGMQQSPITTMPVRPPGGMGNSDPFYQQRMALDAQVNTRNSQGQNATPAQLAEMRRLSELSENSPELNARRDAYNKEVTDRGMFYTQGQSGPSFMNMGGIAGLAQGGYPRRTGQISGPGTEKSDSIPAMLSDGEFVMTAKAVRGAGKGNRRAGAKQMYKLMHQLEKNSERG